MRMRHTGRGTVYCKMPLGKKTDPKEQVREWRGKLRKEQRGIDRQIRAIQTEENKVKKSIKDAAKKGQTDVAKILAKELIQSRKAIGKMYASKAHMNSVMMSMQQQLSTIRMAGAIGKSTEILHAMQSLIKLPEISQAMMELSKEMSKAGMMEEILDETFEGLEDDDVEELADKEVEKVLWEVTSGQLGQLSATPSATPQEEGAVGPEPALVDSDEEEDMTARLQALRS